MEKSKKYKINTDKLNESIDQLNKLLRNLKQKNVDSNSKSISDPKNNYKFDIEPNEKKINLYTKSNILKKSSTQSHITNPVSNTRPNILNSNSHIEPKSKSVELKEKKKKSLKQSDIESKSNIKSKLIISESETNKTHGDKQNYSGHSVLKQSHITKPKLVKPESESEINKTHEDEQNYSGRSVLKHSSIESEKYKGSYLSIKPNREQILIDTTDQIKHMKKYVTELINICEPESINNIDIQIKTRAQIDIIQKKFMTNCFSLCTQIFNMLLEYNVIMVNNDTQPTKYNVATYLNYNKKKKNKEKIKTQGEFIHYCHNVINKIKKFKIFSKYLSMLNIYFKFIDFNAHYIINIIDVYQKFYVVHLIYRSDYTYYLLDKIKNKNSIHQHQSINKE